MIRYKIRITCGLFRIVSIPSQATTHSAHAREHWHGAWGHWAGSLVALGLLEVEGREGEREGGEGPGQISTFGANFHGY